MKILMISPLPPPEGGITSWTLKYVEYSSKLGIDPIIVNNALIGSRGADYTKGRSLKDEVVRTKRILSDFKKKFKVEKPDVVHINTSCSRFGVLRDALCIRIAKKTPIVLHCHCNVEDQLNHKKSAIKAFRWMVLHSSVVLTLNDKSTEYVSVLGGKNIEKLPNYIESEYVNDNFSVNPILKNIVFVGHAEKGKGIAEFIESAKAYPEITFTIVGPVSEEMQQIKRTENVKLIGRQPKEAVQRILRESDLFLFPTYTEGFSVALVEAMASGLPVVTTDVGANKDMIEDKGGIIVPVQNSKSIVEAIKNMQDPVIRQKMSDWNVGKVRNCYLRENVMARLLEIYNEVLL